MSDRGGPSEGFHSPIRPNDGFNPYARPTVPPAPPPSRPAKRGNGISGLAIALIVAVIAIGAGVFVVRTIRSNTPEDAVNDFVHDAYARDAKGVCGLVSKSTKDVIENNGMTCRKRMGELFANLDSSTDGTGADPLFASGSTQPDVTITSVKVDGDDAVVRARIEDGETGSQRIVLVKEGGRWKLDIEASESDDSCARERRTLKLAAEAYNAQNGSYPPDARALVGSFLKKMPEHAVLEADGTVTMTGDCA
jgi:hypothetical protein